MRYDGRYFIYSQIIRKFFREGWGIEFSSSFVGELRDKSPPESVMDFNMDAFIKVFPYQIIISETYE